MSQRGGIRRLKPHVVVQVLLNPLPLIIEEAHPLSVNVLAVKKELLLEAPLLFEPGELIHSTPRLVVRQKNEVHLEDIEDIEPVLNTQDKALLAVSLPLIPLIDDDIYFTFSVYLIDLHQAQNADARSGRDLLKDEPSFSGVMNVLFVEVLELPNGLERLLEKVVHRLVVVMELVKEEEIGLLECP